ncbi:bifunctional phosphoribosylaminoimidazolecarboxamide formyltransferase/IMP cyclohydrolase [Candidatus Aerophobetes bacterium]|nr:bifunctional phosphoribosylaminoimidazolecarboxamide formyltransferase/IMP cyclohydrolase [Candidatus Aerophobetes bacterium]
MFEVNTALLSVWDKTGIVDFAKGLSQLGIQILSTGGTAKLLKEAKISHQEVSEYTGAKEMLGGRVKTLHPKIHAGLLALRDSSEQMDEIKEEGIKPIDMVVVNLYPFARVIRKEGVSMEEALENIDIGGPCMLRAGAKNFKSVAVVSSPKQYSFVLKELKQSKGFLTEETSYELALQVFQTTSSYDTVVAKYLGQRKGTKFPSILNLSFQKIKDLRYGENPHQEAAFYQEADAPTGTLPLAEKLGGKDLSFNNILDFQAAINIASDMNGPFCVVIKHNNPCGAAQGATLQDGCQRAFEGDPVSAFGSVVGTNKTIDEKAAECIASTENFVEGIVAPDYTQEALKILKEKQPWGKNLIILKLPFFRKDAEVDMRRIKGGILLQDEDREILSKDKLKFVTRRSPTQKEMEDLEFAWKLCKYVKSNAILIARDKMVVGVGAGQMSRIDAALIAIKKAGKRCREAVLASDAFFPFPDVVEEAKKAEITAIIQPGGSVKDKEVIETANRCNIAMVFTGIRHFLH